MQLQVVGPLDIAVGRIQFDAAQLLQVGRLGVDEQLVDGGDLQIGDQAQIDAHPDAGEQVHGFFAADRLRRAEDAVGAADPIVQVLLALADQELAGPPFVVDQHGHDIGDLRDQLLFAAAERDLVADLVEVAHGLRAFAVEPADGQADLVQAAEHLFDLPRDDQCRQVQHHADPHAGADVGGAGGQVAPALVEGVGHMLLDQVVDVVDLFPGRLQVQPALHHLDAQMILLVDHQAERLARVDGHGSCPFALGVLAADQLSFDQELAVHVPPAN